MTVLMILSAFFYYVVYYVPPGDLLKLSTYAQRSSDFKLKDSVYTSADDLANLQESLTIAWR